MDVAQHTEAVEAELTRLIEKRSRNGEVDPDELEPGYQESVRIFRERSEAEMRSRWIAFHRNMHRLHTNLADEHAHKAEQLCEKGE